MVFPLLIIPFIAWGIADGERDRRRALSGSQSDSRDAEVVDYVSPQPQREYAEPTSTQSNSSEQLLNCPPLYLPDSAQATFNEVLDNIHKCGLWNDFCTTIVDISHNPSAPTAQVACSQEGYHRGLRGERCKMEIGTEFLGFPSNDLSFAVLHEIHHAMERYKGKPYGRTGEENDANNFADKKLKSIGVSHNFRILPNGTVNRVIHLTGFGGGMRKVEKVYRL